MIYRLCFNHFYGEYGECIQTEQHVDGLFFSPKLTIARSSRIDSLVQISDTW